VSERGGGEKREKDIMACLEKRRQGKENNKQCPSLSISCQLKLGSEKELIKFD
jgi:hypothetical protein